MNHQNRVKQMKMNHQKRVKQMKVHLQKHLRCHLLKQQQQYLCIISYREDKLFWYQHVNVTDEVMSMYSGTEIKGK
eukprot:4616562-Ditylum_brightwellii.AAC.1